MNTLHSIQQLNRTFYWTPWETWEGEGGYPTHRPYIAPGTRIPNHPSTLTSSRRATAAVASNSIFRASSVSVKI
jgi:hypothetical protein